MSAPANWWHDELAGVAPLPRPCTTRPRVEWMRPDPRPRPAAPVRTPRPRPSRTLRLAEGMTALGTAGAWWLLGLMGGLVGVRLVVGLAEAVVR